MSQESCVSVPVLDDQTLAVDAVLFDLDGTLVDSVADLYLGVCGMLHDLGLPPIPVEDVRAYVGRGMHNLVKRHAFGDQPESVCWPVDIIHPQVGQQIDKHLPAMRGGIEV